MQFVIISACAFSMVASSLAWGSEKKEIHQEPFKAPSQSENSISSKQSLSRDVRARKHAGAAGRMGVIGTGVFSMGAEGYALIDGNSQWGGTILFGNDDKSDEIDWLAFDSSDKADLNQIVLAGQGRWFLGNSFSLGGWAGYESSTLTYSVGSGSYTDGVEGKVETSSLIVGGFLGNHWTLDGGLTIGCDWFGLMLPLARNYSKSQTIDETASDSDKRAGDKAQNWGKDHMSKTGLIALMMSVGGQF